MVLRIDMIAFSFEEKITKRTYQMGTSSGLPTAAEGVTEILKMKTLRLKKVE